MRRSLSILLALAFALSTACGKDSKSKKKGPKQAEQALTTENSSSSKKAATEATDRQSLADIEAELENLGVTLQTTSADNVSTPGMNLPQKWKAFTRLAQADRDQMATAEEKLVEYMRLAGIYFKRYDSADNGYYTTIEQKTQSAGEAAEFITNRYLIENVLDARNNLHNNGLIFNYYHSFAGSGRIYSEDARYPSFLDWDRTPSHSEEQTAITLQSELSKMKDTAKAIQEIAVYAKADLWDYETFADHANALEGIASKFLPLASRASDSKYNRAMRAICSLESKGYVFGDQPHEHVIPGYVEEAMRGKWTEQDKATVVEALNAVEEAWYTGDRKASEQDYRLNAAREMTRMIEFRIFAETMMSRNDDLREAGIDLTKSWVKNEVLLSNASDTDRAAYLELMREFQEGYIAVERMFTDPTIDLVTEDYDRERFFSKQEDRAFESFGNLATIVADDLGVSWRKIYTDAYNEAEELLKKFDDN